MIHFARHRPGSAVDMLLEHLPEVVRMCIEKTMLQCTYNMFDSLIMPYIMEGES